METPFAKLRAALQDSTRCSELAELLEACVVAYWTPGKLFDPMMVQMLQTAAAYRLADTMYEIGHAIESLGDTMADKPDQDA